VKISRILERLSESEPGAVVVDKYLKKVILWTLSNYFQRERILEELRKFFPSLEKQDLLLKLDICSSPAMANKILACARATSSSPVIQQLFLLPWREKTPKRKGLLVRQLKRG